VGAAGCARSAGANVTAIVETKATSRLQNFIPLLSSIGERAQ